MTRYVGKIACKSPRWIGRFLALVAVGLLTACGSGAEDELREWMKQERASANPRITPIPPSKAFQPQEYSGEEGADPFSMQRILQALRDASQAARQQELKSETNRPREPLEAYSLDNLVFVGTLSRAGRTVALVKADNLLFQVVPGNRMGQNYGQVMKITDNELVLREIVPDAAGEWTERPATMQLQERAK